MGSRSSGTPLYLQLVSQYGAGGHRQELPIVAVSTRMRLFGPVVPPDGRDLLFRRKHSARGLTWVDALLVAC
jgi:hypothetical protein